MKILVLWEITPFSLVEVYSVSDDPTASNDKVGEAKSIVKFWGWEAHFDINVKRQVKIIVPYV